MGRYSKGAAERPFKITYTHGDRKVGRVVSCASPAGVVRSTTVRVFVGEADMAWVELDDELFAVVEVDENGALQLLTEKAA